MLKPIPAHAILDISIPSREKGSPIHRYSLANIGNLCPQDLPVIERGANPDPATRPIYLTASDSRLSSTYFR